MRGHEVFRRNGMPGFWRSSLRAALAMALYVAMAPAWSVVTVSEPWVRPGQGTQPAEAYMEIRSSEGGTLVRFAASSAQAIRLHAPGKAPPPLTRLALPPGKTTRLAPGGTRFVLQGLPALKVGERVPLTLWIEEAGGATYTLDIAAEVRLRSPTDDERRAHRH
jgi:copper(I)-binding protein